MRTVLLIPLAALSACGGSGEPGAPQGPLPAETRTTPAPIEHDFGTLRHGEAKTLDYVLDTWSLGDRFYPLRVQLDCSCGRGQLWLRAPDGSERPVDGRPTPDNAIRDGETLIARVLVDTRTKDPVDLPHATSRGYVVLQPLDDRTGLRRISWPLLLHFGIDCPVVVKPFAAIDFEKVPRSARPELVLSLAGDENHRGVRFGPVRATDPAITASLEQDGDAETLRVRCTPGEVGNHRAVLTVGTDLADGYEVNLGVTWKVVPDLEVYPLDRLSFYADLAREQTADESRSQYLQVVDHDPRRATEFAVHEIVWDDGRDASACFDVTFAPVPGRPRHERMTVRYRGGLDRNFRGRIVLTAGGDGSPFLPIPLLVFHRS